MSVEDNLRLGAFTRRQEGIEADVERMYGLFPVLDEKRQLPAGTLSGGQRITLSGPGREVLENEQVKAAYLGM